MRISLRVALWLLIALVALGSFWKAGDSSAGDVDASANKKVTLVIDFGATSKRPIVVKALADLKQTATGWSLIKTAGLDAQGTDEFPSGFVCRIQGWPSEQTQDCADTPTSSEGHWAYYVTNSDLGSGWILSGQGAAAHVPECGGYEGWKWVAAGEEASPPSEKPVIEKCQP
jgi:hypothetical protein